MVRKKDLYVYQDLIGLRIKVVTHSDPSLIGLEGIVVDETTNSLLVYVERKNRRIRIPKLYGTFEIKLPSGKNVIVDGILIRGKPEDRLKRILHR